MKFLVSILPVVFLLLGGIFANAQSSNCNPKDCDPECCKKICQSQADCMTQTATLKNEDCAKMVQNSTLLKIWPISYFQNKAEKPEAKNATAASVSTSCRPNASKQAINCTMSGRSAAIAAATPKVQ